MHPESETSAATWANQIRHGVVDDLASLCALHQDCRLDVLHDLGLFLFQGATRARILWLAIVYE